MRTYILNDAMRACQICGKDCSGKELELSLGKDILCLDCNSRIMEWQSSITRWS